MAEGGLLEHEQDEPAPVDEFARLASLAKEYDEQRSLHRTRGLKLAAAQWKTVPTPN